MNGYVYTDLDDNNAYSALDEEQSGVSVELQSSTGAILNTATTNGSGYYTFTGLDCISEYTVSYDDTTATYEPDSAQNEDGSQSTDPGTTTGSTVPVDEF